MTVREQSPANSESIEEKLRKILERVDRLPTLDHRSIDEIMAYNKHGVPS